MGYASEGWMNGAAIAAGVSSETAADVSADEQMPQDM